jgi:large subunit ribosomal protein L29
MKNTDIKELTPEELRQRLDDTKDELFDLRIKKSTGELEQPLRIRTLRRSVAQILTVMNERKTT